MRSNSWHDAICAELRAAAGPLTVDQIWLGMTAGGFHHASQKPRYTLHARIAELVTMQQIKRVGLATYRLVDVRTVATMIDKLATP